MFTMVLCLFSCWATPVIRGNLWWQVKTRMILILTMAFGRRKFYAKKCQRIVKSLRYLPCGGQRPALFACRSTAGLPGHGVGGNCQYSDNYS